VVTAPEAAGAASRHNASTDYEREIEQIDLDIARLRVTVASRPSDVESRVRLVYRLYHRVSLSGDLTGCREVEAAADEAMEQHGPQEDLCLLKANLDFKLHRLVKARSDLEMSTALPGRFEGRTLLAEIDFQEGRYERARVTLEGLIAENRTWDNLARLAYWWSKMGDMDAADRLYVEAADELTAKEMRSYAWVELQRGVLDLARGRYEDAAVHYARANRAYSGYWHVEEHVAELLAAQGLFEEASARYEELLTGVAKPELQQTLGELYLLMGEAERASPWLDRALENYLESARCGDVHYYHHLTDFYADVREDVAEALRWARLDWEMRPNYATQAALAWALYRGGQVPEAARMIKQALESGVRESGLFVQAAGIFGAAGSAGESKRYLDLAAEMNPGYQNFHVHR